MPKIPPKIPTQAVEGWAPQGARIPAIDPARQEADQLIDDIEAASRHPEDIPTDMREDAIRVCAQLIVALTQF